MIEKANGHKLLEPIPELSNKKPTSKDTKY